MTCLVRTYRLIPDVNNPGKIMKTDVGIQHIIYDQTMYFPITHQEKVINTIKKLIRKSNTSIDLEKRMKNLILNMRLSYGLTVFKPLIPKENMGVLIGDPLFTHYL